MKARRSIAIAGSRSWPGAPGGSGGPGWSEGHACPAGRSPGAAPTVERSTDRVYAYASNHQMSNPPDLPDLPDPPDLVVARQAVIRRALLPVAPDAEPHVVIDDTLGHRLTGQVAVAHGAVDIGSHVRCVLETDVRGVREPVHGLPRDLDTLLRVARHLFDQRPVRRDLAVADHAGLDARNAGDRTLLDGLVAVGAERFLGDVRLVGKGNRLRRGRTDVEELARRLPERGARRRVHGRRRRRLLRAAGRAYCNGQGGGHSGPRGLRYVTPPGRDSCSPALQGRRRDRHYLAWRLRR